MACPQQCSTAYTAFYIPAYLYTFCHCTSSSWPGKKLDVLDHFVSVLNNEVGTWFAEINVMITTMTIDLGIYWQYTKCLLDVNLTI